MVLSSREDALRCVLKKIGEDACEHFGKDDLTCAEMLFDDKSAWCHTCAARDALQRIEQGVSTPIPNDASPAELRLLLVSARKDRVVISAALDEMRSKHKELRAELHAARVAETDTEAYFEAVRSYQALIQERDDLRETNKSLLRKVEVLRKANEAFARRDQGPYLEITESATVRTEPMESITRRKK